PAPTTTYPLPLHDALPICGHRFARAQPTGLPGRRAEPSPASRLVRSFRSVIVCRENQGLGQCPASEVRDKLQHLLTRTSEAKGQDRKSTRLNSSHGSSSYA